MEIIQNDLEQPTPTHNGGSTNGDKQEKQDTRAHTMVFVGLLMILLGVLWLLSNLNIVSNSVFDVVFSWQMLLIVLGGYLLVIRNYWLGGGAVAVGTLFLLTDYFNINIPVVEIFLPAVVIAIGVGLIFARKR